MDEQALNLLLECSVCLERLDHTSKVLPCQHTFCRRCLEEIVSTKNELRCPECRTIVTIKVEDLPPNILLIRLLEGLKTQGLSSALSQSVELDTKPTVTPRHESSSSANSQSRQQRQGTQPCAKALFNYEATESGDLSFKKNDVVTLKKQIDENWYHGELNGQHGFFPASYVQVLVPLPQIPQCQGLFDFDLKDENEKDCLSFQKDETLTVIRRVDDNWVEGRKGDKIGIFPITFVKLNDAAKSLLNSKPSVSNLQANIQVSGNSEQSTSTGTSTSSESHRVTSPSVSSITPSMLSSQSTQQKRHSFTLTSQKSSSPSNQHQRRSLELGTSGAFSIATSSPSPVPPPPVSATSVLFSIASTSSHKSVSQSSQAAVSTADVLAKALPGGSVNENSAVVSSSLTTPVYVAVYNYKPQKEDELALNKGDYFTVSEKCQDGWFKGQCLKSGNSGVFPGNYVQIIRHPSAFKPVNPNVLNIRAKGPVPPPPPPSTTSSHSQASSLLPTPSVDCQVNRTTNSSQSSSPSSNQSAPPLMPRAPRTPTTSPPVPVSAASTKVSKSTSLLSANITSSTLKSNTSHSHSQGHSHTTTSVHLPKRSGHSAPQGSGWSSSLAAIHHSMSASSNITPPNVVLGATGENPGSSGHGKERKEKKDKERKSFVKLLAGKAKKSKSPGGESETAVSGDGPVSHTRSGSYPSDGGVGAAGDGNQHRKTASFDSSPPQSAKPARPKPLPREKFRCIVPYPPQTDHELELHPGDIVYVHKKREDGWYKGTLARSGKTGLFPGSFVDKCD